MECFCLIRKTIEVQRVKFGWDLSLRAPTREELRAGSKWLKEEDPYRSRGGFSSNKMDIDKQRRNPEFEEDVTDEIDPLRLREEALENTPVEIIEGKKHPRTRNNQIKEEDNTRDSVQPNDRSTTVVQRADLTQ